MERIECRYNIGVECKDQTNCDRCGWNPKVERYRKKHRELPDPPPQEKKWLLGKGSFESLGKLA